MARNGFCGTMPGPVADAAGTWLRRTTDATASRALRGEPASPPGVESVPVLVTTVLGVVARYRRVEQVFLDPTARAQGPHERAHG